MMYKPLRGAHVQCIEVKPTTQCRMMTVQEVGAEDEQAVLTGPFGTNLTRADFTESGVPVLTISCLTQEGIRLEKAQFVSATKAVELRRYRLAPGDLLFSRMASVGRVGIVSKALEGALFNYHIMRLRLNPQRISARFFAYYVQGAKQVRDYLLAVNHGATRDGINTPQLLAMPVPIPPIKQQECIVAEIEKQFTRLDAGVASLKHLQAALKRYRASVLKAACKGKLTAEWRAENHPKESAADLLARIKTEREARYEQCLREPKTGGMRKAVNAYQIEYRKDQELPDSWATAKLDNLIYIAGRIGWRGLKADEYTQDGPLFLSVYNLNYGEAVDYRDAYHVSRKRYEESPEIMLRNEDILLAKDGAGIGKVGIIKELPKEATINSSLLLIRALEAFVPKYLFYFLAGPELQMLAKQRIAGSATPHLFQKDIRQFYLSVPPLAEQTRIVAEVERRLSVIEELGVLVKRSLLRATRLRQSILQKAFATEGESS
jgi:type I restriction enzyme S subunit